MTVGEVIALICKYASNDDIYLMARDVYSIDIDDEKIYLHFTDANTSNYSIMAKESEQNEDNYETQHSSGQSIMPYKSGRNGC